jgi:nucleotide-binding universal stress UspA family protein
MSAPRTILVPLDGSALAARALPWAYDLARLAGDRVRLALVHRSYTGWSGTAEDLLLAEHDVAARRAEAAYLRLQIEETAAAAGVETATVVLDGGVVGAIADDARDQEIDLIVLASHMRHGVSRLWHGSVAEALARRAPCPVLVLPPEGEIPAEGATRRLRRILVPLDGSAVAEAILGPTKWLAGLLQAELLLTIVPRVFLLAAPGGPTAPRIEQMTRRTMADAEAYLEMMCARLGAEGFHTSYEVLGLDSPAEAIAARASRLDVDMVAMATGQGNVVRHLLGSVTDQVLREAGRPMLVFHPHPVKERLVGAEGGEGERPEPAPEVVAWNAAIRAAAETEGV